MVVEQISWKGSLWEMILEEEAEGEGGEEAEDKEVVDLIVKWRTLV